MPPELFTREYRLIMAYKNEQQRQAAKRYSSLKSRLKKIHNIKLENHWKKEDFIDWFSLPNRKCFYCNTSESESRTFHECHPSKRSNRGLTLEIDRVNSRRTYSEENCVPCCYLCNNSKSDIFNNKESFQPIADGIRSVIIQQLLKEDVLLSSVSDYYPGLSKSELRDICEVIKDRKDPSLVSLQIIKTYPRQLISFLVTINQNSSH